MNGSILMGNSNSNSESKSKSPSIPLLKKGRWVPPFVKGGQGGFALDCNGDAP